MNSATIPTFQCKQTLIRHTDAINTLKISQDGSRLLSGGDDSLVVVWDLTQGIELQAVSVTVNGPVSASAWTPISLNPIASFAFGCADGTLTVYCQAPTKNHYDFSASAAAHIGPVEDIDFDSGSKQIATVGSGCLKLWAIDSEGQLSNIIATNPRQAIARSVSFFDQGSSVLVSFLESHEVVAYQVSPWTMKWTYQLPTRIGHAATAADNQMLIVSNLANGVDIYSLPPGQPLRSFTHPIRDNKPLLVSSALQGSLIVIGGDDGSARVYDSRIGLLTVLPHGQVGTLVQVVTTHSSSDGCLIVTGSSESNGVAIKVWEPPKVENMIPAPQSHRAATTTLNLWHAVALVLTSLAGQIMIAVCFSKPTKAENVVPAPLSHHVATTTLNLWQAVALVVASLVGQIIVAVCFHK